MVVFATIIFAYLVVYPRMEPKSFRRMMHYDLVLSALLMVAVGSVYFGQGIAFSLIFIQAPWWVFTLVAALLIELPFCLMFCKKHGLSPEDMNED
ncbi:hypothetical protein [Sulfitobacter sp. S190]|uniref:hypothetical protein n=1 Tax=Sulfitobacter sp. S190 TaxID=2867022 RepID=UPI0021A6FB6C|nr:hypothetical protein [Sulfitobacter sp. S190]UWR20900.1 hypothetical protein K3756_09155 [Sulfitobacter sp. S190]